jgi:hypothetical protein
LWSQSHNSIQSFFSCDKNLIDNRQRYLFIESSLHPKLNKFLGKFYMSFWKNVEKDSDYPKWWQWWLFPCLSSGASPPRRGKPMVPIVIGRSTGNASVYHIINCFYVLVAQFRVYIKKIMWQGKLNHFLRNWRFFD